MRDFRKAPGIRVDPPTFFDLFFSVWPAPDVHLQYICNLALPTPTTTSTTTTPPRSDGAFHAMSPLSNGAVVRWIQNRHLVDSMSLRQQKCSPFFASRARRICA